jgi:hypothetical protein
MIGFDLQRKHFAALLLGAPILALSGCSFSGNPGFAIPTAVPGAHLTGHVFGGQQPVNGVNVQLYAAGSTGYGSAYPYTAGISLLGNNVVTTTEFGDFNITGDYTCPSASTEVYLVGTGGYPVPGQPANANLAMMAALGPCGNLTSSTYIAVNELTTVATVWALAPFMTAIANVGTSPANSVGLTNAFASVNKLVDTRDAAVPGPALPSGATLPISELNTLANILATCINSSGGISGDGSNCGTLFSLAPSDSGAAPTDTIAAALNIALNPGRNVTSLNNLPGATAPFQPTLGNTAPAAWTIAIRYTANGGLSGPAGIATDQAGNVWIANKTANNVVELDNTGAVMSGAPGYAAALSGLGAIAIDQNGNAWTGGINAGSLLMINPAGAVSTYTGGGLTTTNAVAVDGSGQIWATGTGNSVSAFTGAGVPVSSGSGFTGGGVSNPQGIAIAH